MKKTLKEFIESLPDDEQEEISAETAKLLADYKAGKIKALSWEEVKRRYLASHLLSTPSRL